jgi:hypothetical protein
MIRTQIRRDDKDHELAKAQAAALGISLAEFLRRAVRRVLAAHDVAPWMKYAGFVETGDSHSIQSIDKHV